MLSAIPEVRRDAVRRGLIAAFGTHELDSIVPVSGGFSGAAVYRIRVGAIAYILRIETSRDAFRDPHRAYACMSIAAAGMIAPRVRYADPGDGVAIMDFIPQKSLTLDYPGTREDLIVEAAQTIRALHAGPKFPALVDYMEGMDGLIATFRASQRLPAAATAEVFERFAVLRAAWRTEPQDLVASHNDLNPRNILYDGTRLWLVDWEAAFLADRYVDLSNLANLYAATREQEDLLLATYFGKAEPGHRARLYLMRQVNHLFYAMAMLNSLPPGFGCGEDLDSPDLADIHAAISTGAFVLDTPQGMTTYAKSRLHAALEGLRAPRFEEALAAAGY